MTQAYSNKIPVTIFKVFTIFKLKACRDAGRNENQNPFWATDPFPRVKPVTDEQVFYDKFLCDKFYLLVCTRNVDNFFYDKCTCSKASMLALEQVHFEKIVKLQILFVCMGQQRKLVKVI
jgi:hypothetical protein